MQPQQPSPNYEFIMNPGTQPKKPGFKAGPLGTRLLVILGGIFVVVVIIGIVLRLLGGGSGVNKAALLSVAQDQTEIIRLSTLGGQNSVSQTNKNFSITAQLGVQSGRQELLTYLADNGVKPKVKDLAVKQNAQTDQQLTSAQSSSTFDLVYKGVMQRAFETYRSDLQTAYTDAGPNARKILTANDDAARLLLVQLNGTPATKN